MPDERGISASVINQESFGVGDWSMEISRWSKDDKELVYFVTLLDDEMREKLLQKSLSTKAKNQEGEHKLQHTANLLSLSDEARGKLLTAIVMANID